jgi:hypothetical protein
MSRIANVFLPFLLLAFLLPVIGPAAAQNFHVASSSAVASGNPMDWVQVKIEVTNVAGKTINLRVEITDRSELAEGWDTQICFFQNCFPPGTTAHDGPMAAGYKEELDITFITNGTPGTGTVKVRVTNLDNTSETADLTFTATTGSTSSAPAPLAGEMMLSQNYPNPFALSKTPATTVTYRMSEAGSMTLKVYNLLGKEVRTLVNEFRPVGKSSVSWDGRDSNGRPVPAGIYVYKLSTRSQTLSRRMMITR